MEEERANNPSENVQKIQQEGLNFEEGDTLTDVKCDSCQSILFSPILKIKKLDKKDGKSYIRAVPVGLLQCTSCGKMISLSSLVK